MLIDQSGFDYIGTESMETVPHLWDGMSLDWQGSLAEHQTITGSVLIISSYFPLDFFPQNFAF